MKTARKGFTLIELMVVIVIIGILAALAIPKLFGMSAKAKAAEVGPAAGTWSKLQQAYYHETSSFGDFTMVGYKEPKGDNFSYGGGFSTSVSATWIATNAVDLGDCNSGTWGLTIYSSMTATPYINGSTDCEALTPNFERAFKLE